MDTADDGTGIPAGEAMSNRSSNTSADLPADLRYHAKHVTQGGGTMERAADEIERLTRERDEFKRMAGPAEDIERENERLQAALKGLRESMAKAYEITKDTSKAHEDRVYDIQAVLNGDSSFSDETSERCHFRAFGRLPCEKPKGHDGDHTCQLPADHRAGTEPLSRIIADLEMAISPDLSRSVANRFMIVEEVLRQLRSAEKAPETADDSDFCDCGDYPNGPLRRKADCPRHSSKNGEGEV